MNIGTRVFHKDYPTLIGTIIEVLENKSSERMYSVKWDHGIMSTSRHIQHALERVK